MSLRAVSMWRLGNLSDLFTAVSKITTSLPCVVQYSERAMPSRPWLGFHTNRAQVVRYAVVRDQALTTI